VSRPETRYWIVTAGISACGTLSSLLTAVTSQHPILDRLGIPSEVVEVFTMLTFLAALGASFIGFWSMMMQGVKEVGVLVVGGLRLPRYALPLICIPVYGAPWFFLAWLVLGSSWRGI
jgi:hypothetical protein